MLLLGNFLEYFGLGLFHLPFGLAIPLLNVFGVVVEDVLLNARIWHEIFVVKFSISRWGGIVSLEPVLNGVSLIGVPVAGYHWVNEHLFRNGAEVKLRNVVLFVQNHLF